MTALAFEDRVFFHANLHVQIAGRAAIAPRFALAIQANAIAGIDAGRNFDRQRLFLPHASLSVAAVAGIGNNLAAALAARTRLLNRKNRLLHAHLALAVAGIAGLGRRAFRGARAFTGLTLAHGRNADFSLHAEYRFFQF